MRSARIASSHFRTTHQGKKKESRERERVGKSSGPTHTSIFSLPLTHSLTHSISLPQGHLTAATDGTEYGRLRRSIRIRIRIQPSRPELTLEPHTVGPAHQGMASMADLMQDQQVADIGWRCLSPIRKDLLVEELVRGLGYAGSVKLTETRERSPRHTCVHRPAGKNISFCRRDSTDITGLDCSRREGLVMMDGYDEALLQVRVHGDSSQVANGRMYNYHWCRVISRIQITVTRKICDRQSLTCRRSQLLVP